MGKETHGATDGFTWFGPDGIVETDKTVNICLDKYDVFAIEVAIHTMEVTKKRLPDCKQKLMIEGSMKLLANLVEKYRKLQMNQ